MGTTHIEGEIMREINELREMQKIELDILKYVVKICEKNSLRYFLAGGTLLGAIRHKGFIPWDNDVDISMPRKDYEVLLRLIENDNNSKYRVFYIKNDSDYFYPFAKVCDTSTVLEEYQVPYKIKDLGLYIDIFPIDGVGNDKEIAQKKVLSIQKWSRRIRVAIIPTNFQTSLKWRILRSAFKLICNICGVKTFLHHFEKKLEIPSFDESKYVASTFGARAEKEVIEQIHFSSSVLVDFEGEKFNSPIGYDQYLKQMYGDYMKLPPESERVTCHDIKVYEI